jgi:hypothetical protein
MLFRLAAIIGAVHERRVAAASDGNHIELPAFASANLIRYNSCDRGVKHACDKDGEGQWQRQRLKRRIALL